MNRFIVFTTVVSLCGLAHAHDETESCPYGHKLYRAGIRHIESGGIGYEDGYTTLETFLSSDPNQWAITPFLDIRGHIFNNGKWALNAGPGIRALFGNRVYGINAYYDYRNTHHFHSNQIGLGLETLGTLFDFRVNGYLPIGVKVSSPYDATFGAFAGNHLLLTQKYHSAMKGADAECGFHFGKTKYFDFYTAVGPYYFIGKMAPATWGGKAKIGGTFRDILTVEISDSYDRTFHNKLQGQIGLTFRFGPKSRIRKQGQSCQLATSLNSRMLQPVSRQEIIVIDKVKKKTAAINPVTGLPYFFVFVNNTSSSNGTIESPYHSLTQAQEHSSVNDIIYVFPGDGTTSGMDSGIFLKANQKFWGSGISHLIQTSQGMISIPAQSSSSPTITNTNIDTEGDAITLATNNAISGFNITSALHDAIYGADAQSLEVSSCLFTNISTFPIEATFSGNAAIAVTDNQFLNNGNGVMLTLNGTSTVLCSNNTFEEQSSISSVPLEIAAHANIFSLLVENNIFHHNTTGGVRLNLTDVVDANVSLLNNTLTNNDTGFSSTLGSSFVIEQNGTTDHCSILLQDNIFSNNTSNALYLHTSGTFTTLAITAATNTMSDNGGSALVIATPSNALTLIVTDNIITGSNDNGIAVISGSTTSTGNITIHNNTISNIGNTSNGIAINQNFSNLTLTISNNEINECEGTGILSYSPNGIENLVVNISNNTISSCQNLSSNAASGLDIEQYINLTGSITNNTLSANTTEAVFFGSTLPSPTTCLTLTGNDNSANYDLSNPVDGTFNLSPCNVNSVNTGVINTSGIITPVQSCPDATPCPP